MIEYSLIMVLVVVILIVVVALLGNQTKNTYSNIVSAIGA